MPTCRARNPVQSTAFRPPEDAKLNANPFRIFASRLLPAANADEA
ncbi:2-oxoadipate dioxygenase/decarboxylase family protein [Phaeovulum sp. W22_SRMD_FR3]